MRKIVLMMVVVFGLLMMGCPLPVGTPTPEGSGSTPTSEDSGNMKVPTVPDVVKKALNGLSLVPNDSTNESAPLESLISGIEEHHDVIAESNRFLTAIAVFTEAREKFEKIRNDQNPTDEVGLDYNILTSEEFAEKVQEHDTAIIQFRKDRGRFIRGLKFIKERKVMADEVVEYVEKTRDFYAGYTPGNGLRTNRSESLNKILESVERCTYTEGALHYHDTWREYSDLLNNFWKYFPNTKGRVYRYRHDELSPTEERTPKLTLLRKLKEEFDPEEDYEKYRGHYHFTTDNWPGDPSTVKAEDIGVRRIKAETDYAEFRKKFWELERDFYMEEDTIIYHNDADAISIMNDLKNAWEEIVELLNTLVKETMKERDYIHSL